MAEEKEEKMKETGRKKKERERRILRRLRGGEGYNRREGEKDG